MLGATAFGEWGDGTGGDESSARGRWLHGGIGWVVPQANNEFDGVTDVRVRSIHVNPQGSRKSLVQDRGSCQQLLAVHQEKVRVAAERYLLKGSNHDSVLCRIFVLDGHKHFAGMVCRSHTLDEARSSPRGVVGM